jgi:hypothetical protein
MNRETDLLPFHIIMFIMVIGFGCFFWMVIDGTKRVGKQARKAKKKARKFLIKIKRQQMLKRNWFYEI